MASQQQSIDDQSLGAFDDNHSPPRPSQEDPATEDDNIDSIIEENKKQLASDIGDVPQENAANSTAVPPPNKKSKKVSSSNGGKKAGSKRTNQPPTTEDEQAADASGEADGPPENTLGNYLTHLFFLFVLLSCWLMLLFYLMSRKGVHPYYYSILDLFHSFMSFILFALATRLTNEGNQDLGRNGFAPPN